MPVTDQDRQAAEYLRRPDVYSGLSDTDRREADTFLALVDELGGTATAPAPAPAPAIPVEQPVSRPTTFIGAAGQGMLDRMNGLRRAFGRGAVETGRVVPGVLALAGADRAAGAANRKLSAISDEFYAPDAQRQAAWQKQGADKYRDPQWWAQGLAENVPALTALIAPAAGAARLGMAGAARLGAGKVGQALAGAAAGTLMATPAEAAMEGGGAMADAARQGVTDDAVLARIGRKVAAKNAAMLLFSNFGQFGAGAAGATVARGLRVAAGKGLLGDVARKAVEFGGVAVGALPEAEEELRQDEFRNNAIAEAFAQKLDEKGFLTPRIAEAFNDPEKRDTAVMSAFLGLFGEALGGAFAGETAPRVHVQPRAIVDQKVDLLHPEPATPTAVEQVPPTAPVQQRPPPAAQAIPGVEGYVPGAEAAGAPAWLEGAFSGAQVSRPVEPPAPEAIPVSSGAGLPPVATVPQGQGIAGPEFGDLFGQEMEPPPPVTRSAIPLPSGATMDLLNAGIAPQLAPIMPNMQSQVPPPVPPAIDPEVLDYLYRISDATDPTLPPEALVRQPPRLSPSIAEGADLMRRMGPPVAQPPVPETPDWREVVDGIRQQVGIPTGQVAEPVTQAIPTEPVAMGAPEQPDLLELPPAVADRRQRALAALDRRVAQLAPVLDNRGTTRDDWIQAKAEITRLTAARHAVEQGLYDEAMARVPKVVEPAPEPVVEPPPVAPQPTPAIPASGNPYLRMPIERVRKDAEQGVRAAKEALGEREKAATPPPVSAVPVQETPAARETRAQPRAIGTAKVRYTRGELGHYDDIESTIFDDGTARPTKAAMVALRKNGLLGDPGTPPIGDRTDWSKWGFIVGEVTPATSAKPELGAPQSIGTPAQSAAPVETAKPRTTATNYLNETINYGGEKWTRGAAIADMQEKGGTKEQIDAYMMGAKAAEAPAVAAPEHDPNALSVTYTAPDGNRRTVTTREVKYADLPDSMKKMVDHEAESLRQLSVTSSTNQALYGREHADWENIRKGKRKVTLTTYSTAEETTHSINRDGPKQEFAGWANRANLMDAVYNKPAEALRGELEAARAAKAADEKRKADEAEIGRRIEYATQLRLRSEANAQKWRRKKITFNDQSGKPLEPVSAEILNDTAVHRKYGAGNPKWDRLQWTVSSLRHGWAIGHYETREEAKVAAYRMSGVPLGTGEKLTKGAMETLRRLAESPFATLPSESAGPAVSAPAPAAPSPAVKPAAPEPPSPSRFTPGDKLRVTLGEGDKAVTVAAEVTAVHDDGSVTVKRGKKEYRVNEDAIRGSAERFRAREQSPVTPEQDAAYLAAVERGDMDTAQRMVDAAAKAAGYNVGPMFHATSADFTVFDVTKGEGGIHVGTQYQASQIPLATKVLRVFVRAKNPAAIDDLEVNDIYSVALQLSNSGRISHDAAREVHGAALRLDAEKNQYPVSKSDYEAYLRRYPEPTEPPSHVLLRHLLAAGYDSLVYDNRVEYDGPTPKWPHTGRLMPRGGEKSYLLLSSSQVKSAEPITRDDTGRVIPLSERFNPESPDIRYRITAQPEVQTNAPESTPQPSLFAPTETRLGHAPDLPPADARRRAYGPEDEARIRRQLEASRSRVLRRSSAAPAVRRAWQGVTYSPVLARDPEFQQLAARAEQHGLVLVPVRGVTAFDAATIDDMILLTEDHAAPLARLFDHELFHAKVNDGDADAMAAVLAIDTASDTFRAYGDWLTAAGFNAPDSPHWAAAVAEELAADIEAGVETIRHAGRDWRLREALSGQVAEPARQTTGAAAGPRYRFRGEWWIQETGKPVESGKDGGHIALVVAQLKMVAADELDLAVEDVTPDAVERNYQRLLDAGMTPEQLNALGADGKDGGRMDPRDIAIRSLGWIRVSGHDVQVAKLDADTLERLATGLTESWGDGAGRETVNIETMEPAGYYVDVPYSVVVAGDPGAVRDYRAAGVRYRARESLPEPRPGDVLIRYTSRTGRGLLNHSAYNTDKLNDEDAQELEDWLNYGLQHPRDVPSEATFYFTVHGVDRHRRYLDLMAKAARNGVVVSKVRLSGVPVWTSDDGQVAVLPGQATPVPDDTAAAAGPADPRYRIRPASPTADRFRELAPGAAGLPRAMPEHVEPEQTAAGKQARNVIHTIREENGEPDPQSVKAADERARQDVDTQGAEAVAGRIADGEVALDSQYGVRLAINAMDRLAPAALKGDSPEAAALYCRVAMQLENHGTEVARNLNAFRDLYHTGPDRARAMIAGALFTPSAKHRKHLAGMTTDEVAKWFRANAGEVAKVAKDAQASLASEGYDDIDLANLTDEQLRDPATLAAIIRAIQAAKASPWDKAYEYWINWGLLSVPTTHTANMFGNLLFAGTELTLQRGIETVLASGLRAMGQRGREYAATAATAGEFRAVARAFAPALRFARASAKRAWQTEMPQVGQEGRLEFDERGKAWGGRTGRWMRGPGRALLWADEFAKGIVRTTEAAAWAHREAVNVLKLTDQAAIAEYIAKQMAEPNSAANVYGQNRALELTFNAKPGGMLGAGAVALMHARNGDTFSGRVLRFLFPFIRTPYNIIRTTVRKSPLGVVNLATSAARGKYAQNADLLVKHAAEQVLAGAAILGVLAALGDDDRDDGFSITGSRANYRQGGKREFQQENRPAMSMRFVTGGRWYSYQRLEPFAGILAMVVDAVNESRASGHGKAGDKTLAAAFNTAVSQVRDKTFLQTVGDVTRAMEEPRAAGSMVANFLASWVPGMGRGLARSLDDDVRDQRNYSRGWAYWKTQLTASVADRAGLPLSVPRVDLWGRDIDKTAATGLAPFDVLYRIGIPVAVQKTEVEPVERMVLKWNSEHPDDERWPDVPQFWRRTKDGTRYMTEESYYRYTRRAGELARQRVAELLARKAFKVDAPTANDMDRLADVFRLARDRARAELEKSGDIRYVDLANRPVESAHRQRVATVGQSGV